MSDYIQEKVEELKKLLENRDDEGHLDTDDQEFIYFFQSSLQEMEERVKVTEDTSDGYHTFKELYEFRKVYNAVLFNEWTSQGKYNVHKSIRHHDGELCFGGGWFIVVADLPSGQISNHYELKDWDLFQCAEREKAEEWDGHTAQDVAKRLEALLSPSEEKECDCDDPHYVPGGSTLKGEKLDFGKKEKECLCHCHESSDKLDKPGHKYCIQESCIKACSHCSPKKEKRGR